MNRTSTKVIGALILAGCALGWVSLGMADGKPPADPQVNAVIPFQLLKTGHMTVEVKVNDKGPYTLIFDTGAPMNLVNNKVAREAELLKGKSAPLFTPFGAKGDVKIKKLEVGKGVASNIGAAVMDHPTVSLISKHFGPIEGIIGFPFFARYKMTLDYRDQTLTMEPGTYQPPDVMKEMMKGLFGNEGTTKDSVKVVAPGALLGIVAGENGDNGSGLSVASVLEGTPAAQAGIRAGDKLVTVSGRWTDTRGDFIQAVSHLKPGVSVNLEVNRAGQVLKIPVVPVSGF